MVSSCAIGEDKDPAGVLRADRDGIGSSSAFCGRPRFRTRNRTRNVPFLSDSDYSFEVYRSRKDPGNYNAQFEFKLNRRGKFAAGIIQSAKGRDVVKRRLTKGSHHPHAHPSGRTRVPCTEVRFAKGFRHMYVRGWM